MVVTRTNKNGNIIAVRADYNDDGIIYVHSGVLSGDAVQVDTERLGHFIDFDSGEIYPSNEDELRVLLERILNSVFLDGE